MIKEIKSNVTVTTAMREVVNERIFKKLDKFEPHITDVIVKINVTNSVHEVTVLLKLKGQPRFNKVSAKSQDFYVSIADVSEKSLRKVTNYKQKSEHEKHRSGAIIPFHNFPAVTMEHDETEFDIAKIKRFKMDPIYVEEAINQMEDLGHSFFFYFDASANTPCVVYKRNDGNYGIIEADL